jgi:DNA (cytosine-5)-methyltransferase 1
MKRIRGLEGKATTSKDHGSVVGLFAGIGGFEVGFAEAGYKMALLCELDPAAQSVLQHQFARVPMISDVREIDVLPRNTQIVTAGFPCQNLSSSGRKAGIVGTQSSLIKEVFRILKVRPVEWVVIENVPFMLRLRRGEAIRSIAGSLERLGYNWAYRVIDSQSLGVPQRRKRVFIVASLTNDPRGVLLGCDEPAFEECTRLRDRPLDKPIGFYWTEGAYSTGLAYDALPPLKSGSTIGIASPPAVLFPDGRVATPDIRDAEAIQGFAPDWTVGALENFKSSLRWKLVGNAVTVNVARWLASRIANPPAFKEHDCEPLSGGSWPSAAWSVDGDRYTADVTSYPLRAHRGLEGFLAHNPRPLSKRAIDGFLSRVRRGGLWYPDGFLEMLERYANRVVVGV